MWEIPWWSALIMVWAAGNIGFVLGAILALGKQADKATATLQPKELRWARSRANAPRRM